MQMPNISSLLFIFFKLTALIIISCHNSIIFRFFIVTIIDMVLIIKTYMDAFSTFSHYFIFLSPSGPGPASQAGRLCNAGHAGRITYRYPLIHSKYLNASQNLKHILSSHSSYSCSDPQYASQFWHISLNSSVVLSLFK